MGLEGEVVVRSNVDRRSRPENNENIHLTTMEQMCSHSIGDGQSAFKSNSGFKVDCPSLVLIWSESMLRS